MTYAEWVAAYVAEHGGFVRGRCAQAVEAMTAAFPELRRAVGFARWTASHGRDVEDQHHWCVAPDGTIVDPTAAQFFGPVAYEELNLNDPADRAKIPTGLCMGCGGPIYDGGSFCGEACEADVCRDMGLVSCGPGRWRSG